MTTFYFAAASKVFGGKVNAQTMQDFLDETLRECQATGDVLATWMVEQLAIMRFTSAFLHSLAVQDRSAQELAAISSAACNLTGEMRRTLMTLRDYRANNGLSRSKRDADEEATTKEASCKTSQRPCKKAPRRRKAKLKA